MKVIAVYPGRFHPFHKGHAQSFKQLADSFGLKNTYLALSQKQEMPKSPFSASDRAKMAMALGIPKENIISVKNTYGGDEYIQRFEQAGLDPNQTALVFGVSAKDMDEDPRFSFAPKKDGNPSYLQPYGNNLQPMTKHAYVTTTDVGEFPVAGTVMRDASAIRAAYMKGNEKTRNKILSDLYGPKAAKLLKPIFDSNLQLTENFYNKLKQLKQKLAEAHPKSVDLELHANQLNELAPGGEFGGGASYFLTIARAWYYHDLTELGKLSKQGKLKSPLQHIMNAQMAVEKMLDKGIMAPDGVKRKYTIDYNANYDGVIIYSDDYYEYSDYDETGNTIDERTGKPWGEYDYMEFNDDQLKSGILEGLVLQPEDLVDIYIKGKTAKGNNLSAKIGQGVPNKHVLKYIDFLAKKYRVNPSAIVYGPSSVNRAVAENNKEDYLEEK
jgi:hypothetical protein